MLVMLVLTSWWYDSSDLASSVLCFGHALLERVKLVAAFFYPFYTYRSIFIVLKRDDLVAVACGGCARARRRKPAACTLMLHDPCTDLVHI